MHGAHHDRAGVLDELVEGRSGRLGMIDVADGLGEAAMGAKAGDFVEGQFRPRRDHQIVVVQHRPIIELQAILGGHEPLGAHAGEADALLLEDRRQLDLNGAALAPVDRDPWVGRDKVEGVALRHDADVCARANRFLDLEGGDRASKPGAQDDNAWIGHSRSPPRAIDVRRHVPPVSVVRL
ncbi:hypothetical protein GALL_498670 [mine drainage metagenome]|uniref:Uncharacterized protein n=1 Tax=mine drainage metagenome TaxID=410659 RepID=A0A1J5PLV5_9ZZZZ